MVFAASTQTLDVWHHYLSFVGVVGGIVTDIVGTSIGPVGFRVGPIQSPIRVLASSCCSSEVLFFLFK